ncbi:MAG: prepilin peptidase [Deltaproteobacteria bacterium]|nr:MAG: prepilin peptidase [Deltaproteobacteria bacterium]
MDMLLYPLFSAAASLPPLPAWYIYGFTFFMGAAVGSFLNVCILRIPEEGVSIFYPKNSRCPVCKTEIKWYDNIPIASWLWLRGKCRSCKTPISMQYPLVELLTAVMALAIVKTFGVQPVSLVYFVLVCSLIVITFIDMAWWIIPDVISLPGIVLGIALAYFVGHPLPTWQDAAFGALLGGGLFLTISQGYAWITGREGMGMGDAKLLGMLGAFLGWKALPLVILLASAQGLLAALVLYLLGWREGVPDDFYEDEEEAQGTVESNEKAAEKPSEPAEAEEVAAVEESVEASGASDEAPVGEPEASSEEASAEKDPESEEEEEPGLRGIAIPFGPFLSLAAIEFLFWGERMYLWVAKYLQMPM